MSGAATMSNRLKYSPKGRPFSVNRFAEVGPRAAVAQALARLVRTGKLERITRGIYMGRSLAHMPAGSVLACGRCSGSSLSTIKKRSSAMAPRRSEHFI